MTTPTTAAAPTIRTAAALEREARRDGYQPGFPPQLSRVNRHVDQSACRRMTCPACLSRGMGAKPYHKLDGYRVVAVCPKCGAGELA